MADTYKRLLSGGVGTRVQQIDAARRSWSNGFVADGINEAGQTPRVNSSSRRHAGR